MSSIANHAEVLKLSRLLGVETSELSFLEKHDALAIRALREQMAAQLFDDGKALLLKVAAATKLTPVGIAAIIAEKALGPLLCARVASLLPADRAIDIAKRLGTPFLAEVCLHLDPRKTTDIIRGTPVEQVVDVARILQAQQEFVTMARFVDALTPEAIKAVIAATPDEEPLLRTALFAENPARLNELVSFMPKARLQRLISKAAGHDELWIAALSLMTHLDAQWKAELGQLTVALDEATLGQIVAHTQKHQLWAVLLPVIASLPAPAQQIMFKHPALEDDAVLNAIAKAAQQKELAETIKVLGKQLPPSLKKKLAP
jgi:hypothetical protein